MKKILGFLFLAVICSTQVMAQQKITQEFRDAQARVADGVAQVYIKPTVAEVQLINNGQRIKKTYSLTSAEVNGMNGSVANIRAYASFLASEEFNCDIILSPLYMIKNDKDTNIYYVTVVGYPARFANWAPVKDTDWQWIDRRGKSGGDDIIIKNTGKTQN